MTRGICKPGTVCKKNRANCKQGSRLGLGAGRKGKNRILSCKTNILKSPPSHVSPIASSQDPSPQFLLCSLLLSLVGRSLPVSLLRHGATWEGSGKCSNCPNRWAYKAYRPRATFSQRHLCNSVELSYSLVYLTDIYHIQKLWRLLRFFPPHNNKIEVDSNRRWWWTQTRRCPLSQRYASVALSWHSTGFVFSFLTFFLRESENDFIFIWLAFFFALVLISTMSILTTPSVSYENARYVSSIYA